MTRLSLWSLVATCLVVVAFPACSVEEDDAEADGAALTDQVANDLPWEVTTDQGEAVLPNLFYAEASENEQVMPTALDGHVQIDRLVYPTIGNPNLYTKSDPKDSLLAVLRIEEKYLEHLSPDTSEAVPGTSLNFVKLTEDDDNALAFYLVDHKGRAAATETEQAARADESHVHRIRPSAIRIHPVPDDMPKPFKRRRTLRVTFDQQAMADVPPGLYDLRFEVTQGGRVLSEQSGAGAVYEYQYNAVRVFERGVDDYSVISVTDTQVSLGASFTVLTLGKLKEFVQRVNASTDPTVRNAAFITFNGDLHNGGAPDNVNPTTVATTYNDEAKVILETLKELSFPIFLTAGNHDGYVATGHAPALFDPDGSKLRSAVDNAKPKAWPNFQWEDYQAYLDKTTKQPAGLHADVFEGQHVRRHKVKTFKEAWLPVNPAVRNLVLYDGFNQWKKTYGPLYHSWSYGKSYFINMNTYDLRQHRRSGWGMYTVNYGGGLSKVQSDWIKREIARVENDKNDPKDVVLLGHHDPRGGHNGKDHPYYFKQVDYEGMVGVAMNYIQGEMINPQLCAIVPDWVKSDTNQLSCLHDGLQEWMLADSEFDCDDADRLADGTCNVESFKGTQKHPWYSGYALLDHIAKNSTVRTLLLGHTHYNSLEILQKDDALVPEKVTLSAEDAGSLEASNPTRAFSWLRSLSPEPETTYDPARLAAVGIEKDGERWVLYLDRAGHDFQRKIGGAAGRELVILRMTSNADLTSQKFCETTGLCKAMYGYATFKVTKRSDERGYDLPQINTINFFVNDAGKFEKVKTTEIDRTKRVARAADVNPVDSLFKF